MNLGPVALFNEAKLTTNCSRYLEKFENLHTAPLMYQRLSSPAGTSELVDGFHSILENRRRELTNSRQPHSKKFFL